MPVHPDTLKKLSTKPGVYLFRDAAGEVLYVGKAKSLRPRVRSYFASGRDLSAKNRRLVGEIDGERFDVGPTGELEYPLSPGKHHVTAARPGYRSSSWPSGPRPAAPLWGSC